MKRSLFSLITLFLSFTCLTALAQTTPTGESEAMMGFGQAVAVSDGSIFIGEPSNIHQSGVVYVYAGADWSQEAFFSASDGEIDDGFGSALSADGNRILVGAPDNSDGRGAAYVFERAGDGSWSEAARFAIADTSIEGELGSSVALSGELAFVGAPDEEEGLGAVYVFGRDDSGTWSRQARLANPDTARGTSFGSALAVDGSTLLVGAPEEQGGAVYAFSSEAMGGWTLEQTIATNQLTQQAGFGSALALQDGQALIAAPNNNMASGTVFVYERNADDGSWNMNSRLAAYDGGPFYQFGSSLAFVGSDAWIGSPNADDGRGALYQYRRSADGDGWVGAEKFGGPERGEGDEFGDTFAVDGDVAVAGLTGSDYGAGSAAIVERDNAGTWNVQKKLIPEGSSVLDPITGNQVECSDGQASLFGCSNVNLLSFLPIPDIGGDRGVRLNDMWGWTDPQTGQEYAIVGRNEGTSFVDVSNPTNPVYVGTIPMPESSQASTWRDIKVYQNHAYIVADNAAQHGMQVVDLTELRNYEGTPLHLEEAAHYDGIHSAHNVVINTDSGFAYVVGSSGGGNTCGGGLHMVNIQDPTNPTFAGCFADPSTGRSGTGYSHDAQCVNYHGPDEDYQGSEICLGANETAISIADVTDKENPEAISTASYPDHAYIHQGWLTEDHRYYFQNDELDELSGNVDHTRTLVWDLTDLDDPQFVREYLLDNQSSDHNLYIEGNTMYQSNYVSGLQVIDVSDPANPQRVGEFDTMPFGEDTPGFSGTWSNYPFFESGIVVMTSSREGLFILQKQEQEM